MAWGIRDVVDPFLGSHVSFFAVQEVTHLLERNHNERFTELVVGFLPDWRAWRNLRNAAPLAEEIWGKSNAWSNIGSCTYIRSCGGA